MENTNSTQIGFAQKRLPWVIAAGALLFYLITMARWGTFASLPFIAKVTGWDWRLSFHGPLTLLFFYPVRWLPTAWQLVAVNVMTVVCAAVALGLLARSVALLPQDRTKEQRLLERSDYSFLTIPAAWVPPLLAALVCGLQLTFWENAVAGTGEALDLLCFAFVVWSLLEYRIDEREWRLVLAALVQGLAMANNFAMVAFFPVFVGVVIWVKGLAFFNVRFLLRMAGVGGVGLLLYFLLPFWNRASGLTELSFWEILFVNLGYQKSMLLGFPRYLLLIIALTSLVPILFIGIRWPAQVGDISAVGAGLTRIMTMVVHAVFLGACVDVMFDPPFSPRALGSGRLGVGFPFLPLYFLSALSAGYFAGYFLLVCGARPTKAWEKPSLLARLTNRGLVWATWVILVVAPILLFRQNYLEVKLRQGGELALYGEEALKALPPDKPALVMSDDSVRLLALRSVLSQQKPDHRYVLVDTGSMSHPAYHRWQNQAHPQNWPDTLASHPLPEVISEPDILQFVVQVSSNMPVYYLHQSFGYYFEHFFAWTKGLVSELWALPTNAVAAPLLSAGELKINRDVLEALYNNPVLQNLTQVITNKSHSPQLASLLQYYAQIYSSAFNNFGVVLQRTQDTEAAGAFFSRALTLNPENPCAYINKKYNDYLQKRTAKPPEPDEHSKELLAPYAGNWNLILSLNGPIDEPNSRFLLAQVLLQGNNFRQAAQQLLRCLELRPSLFLAQVSLASTHIKLNRPEEALQLVAALRGTQPTNSLPIELQMKMLEAEAWAHVLKADLLQAERLLSEARTAFPRQSEPFSVLANIYLWLGRQTNAVEVYRELLTKKPNDVPVILNLSALLIVQANYLDAIALLNRAFSLEPKNAGVLINRAIAHLRAGHYPAAKQDYEMLAAISPKPIPAVAYGLGEIAWMEKDYPEALRQYRQVLKIGRPGSAEVLIARQRVAAIKAGDL